MTENIQKPLPEVSVIIPTFYRAELLKKNLQALSGQDFPHTRFEVLVVLESDCQPSREVLAGFSSGFKLRLIESSQNGPAEKRNRGAGQASGRLLIFLDDDIIPAANFISSHVKAHAGVHNRIVVGYSRPVLNQQKGFFRNALRSWWEEIFWRMAVPGYRFNYKNLLSGNFSLEKGMWKEVGGFNPAFRCHEDYELGFRLIKRGAELVFSPEAIGNHYEMTGLQVTLNRKFEEGKADVMLVRSYPELLKTLPLSFSNEQYFRLLVLSRRIAVDYPIAKGFYSHTLLIFLRIFEALKMRNWWRYFLDGLLTVYYWNGVMSEVTAKSGLQKLLKDSRLNETNKSGMQIDLTEGWETVEKRIDQDRPDAIEVFYDHHQIGIIENVPGAENLKGAHLRPGIAANFPQPLIAAVWERVDNGRPETEAPLKLLQKLKKWEKQHHCKISVLPR
ncbi:MAG: glycosyltransferase [Calditrichia bacterium]